MCGGSWVWNWPKRFRISISNLLTRSHDELSPNLKMEVLKVFLFIKNNWQIRSWHLTSQSILYWKWRSKEFHPCIKTRLQLKTPCLVPLSETLWNHNSNVCCTLEYWRVGKMRATCTGGHVMLQWKAQGATIYRCCHNILGGSDWNVCHSSPVWVWGWYNKVKSWMPKWGREKQCDWLSTWCRPTLSILIHTLTDNLVDSPHEFCELWLKHTLNIDWENPLLHFLSNKCGLLFGVMRCYTFLPTSSFFLSTKIYHILPCAY